MRLRNRLGNRLGNKLALVGLSGLMFTGAAIGLAGVASAQDTGTVLDDVGGSGAEVLGEDGTHSNAEEFGELDGDFGGFELSPEDEAVFDRYDKCLIDNGLDEDALFGDQDLTDGSGKRLKRPLTRSSKPAIRSWRTSVRITPTPSKTATGSTVNSTGNSMVNSMRTLTGTSGISRSLSSPPRTRRYSRSSSSA